MVSLFGKKSNGGSSIELNMTNILIGVLMTLIIVQVFGLILSGPTGLNIKLGPVFVLLPIGVASLIAMTIFKKMSNNEFVSQQDIFAVIVVFIISVIIMFFLPDFVPQIFSVHLDGLQSLIGFR